ncbi:MAG TPA: hypothetical protein VFA09_01360 [Ktedonobacteraceae bacterium]|jgi:hypothetical protein|nr:hypothetical protein [Ktedonobacteraceae bacterium]HZU65898.1 hypothetical protein [Ktedonobacteraceae bacterium]
MGITGEEHLHGCSGRDGLAARAQVRRSLRALIQEAQRQGCLEQVQQLPELFVLFLLSYDLLISEAVTLGVVTLHEVCAWLQVLVQEAAGDGTGRA